MGHQVPRIICGEDRRPILGLRLHLIKQTEHDQKKGPQWAPISRKWTTAHTAARAGDAAEACDMTLTLA
ncbi:hypothetical protein NDU88_005595 [Pleurodeles waltl]|uniref:Uncharacterized protein n=1 Tax=Pleurodeles waltl TaxID=8319 RepID=A0AAV7NX25_PLEWA|nr:hypothetical protein NDU88_005595 [Pleurodeles waltl]